LPKEKQAVFLSYEKIIERNGVLGVGGEVKVNFEGKKRKGQGEGPPFFLRGTCHRRVGKTMLTTQSLSG